MTIIKSVTPFEFRCMLHDIIFWLYSHTAPCLWHILKNLLVLLCVSNVQKFVPPEFSLCKCNSGGINCQLCLSRSYNEYYVPHSPASSAPSQFKCRLHHLPLQNAHMMMMIQFLLVWIGRSFVESLCLGSYMAYLS